MSGELCCVQGSCAAACFTAPLSQRIRDQFTATERTRSYITDLISGAGPTATSLAHQTTNSHTLPQKKPFSPHSAAGAATPQAPAWPHWGAGNCGGDGGGVYCVCSCEGSVRLTKCDGLCLCNSPSPVARLSPLRGAQPCVPAQCDPSAEI